LQSRVPDLSHVEAAKLIGDLVTASIGQESADRAAVEWLEAQGKQIESFIEEEAQRSAEEQIMKLFATLSTARQADLSRDLAGFTRVANLRRSH